MDEMAGAMFAEQVKAVVGPSLSAPGFTFDQVLSVDEGRRQRLRRVLPKHVLQEQVWLARERESNCMTASLDAPYVPGLYDTSAQWHHLSHFGAQPDIPLEQLIAQLRSDKTNFGDRDVWLTWLATRIDDQYESAPGHIQGQENFEGRDHERQ